MFRRTMTRALLSLFLVGMPGSPGAAADLKTPAEVGADGAALFMEMGQVLTHPRCINCHPAGRRPLQGELSLPHQPPVWAGRDGHGVVAMRCATCHASSNYDPAKVPGNPNWHLAPAAMAWEGLTVGELCQQLKDPSRNGGRSLEAIVEHLRHDSLVGWAWKPGAGREPAPGSQEQLAALAQAWLAAGAACPEE